MKMHAFLHITFVSIFFTLFNIPVLAQSGRVGIGTTTPLAPFHVDSTVVFTGTYLSEGFAPLTISGAGTRLMWYPDKGAFRAGSVLSAGANRWNTDSIGFHSFAAGRSTIALGDRSMAMGFASHARGIASVALGHRNKAVGDYSGAIGLNLTSQAYGSFTIGQYNVGGGNSSTWELTDPVFEIGIGTSEGAKANAMTVLKNGNVGIGETAPKESLEVSGAIKIGSNVDEAPAAGTIRWNETNQDFEGYDGSQWRSLTMIGQASSTFGLTNCSYSCTYIENLKLTAADADAAANFGNSVSVSGDYAIVGALHDDNGGFNSGSAYIFFRSENNWIQQAKLAAADADADDTFGASVSISGDYAIVGAPNDEDMGLSSGSAYIFVRSGTTWTQQAKLTASDADISDLFGTSVSISGDYAIIGAPWADDEIGSAYIFVRSGTTWTQQAKLTASDAASFDYFGTSVSISGDYAIIGAPYDDDVGDDSGSAYIFMRSGTTWMEEAKSTLSGGPSGNNKAQYYYGYSVSISGDYAIVGRGSFGGTAYVIVRSGTTWTQQAQLTAADAASFDYFGTSVSISGDYAIVGAWGDDGEGSNSGSAYVFVRSGTIWTQEVKLTASDASVEDNFGYSVSISGNYSIVGARFDDDGGNNSGSAYIFEK